MEATRALFLKEFVKFVSCFYSETTSKCKFVKIRTENTLADFSDINKGFKKKICVATTSAIAQGKENTCIKHAKVGGGSLLSSAREEAFNAKNASCNSSAMSRLKLEMLITGRTNENKGVDLGILGSKGGDVCYRGTDLDKPDVVHQGYKYKGNCALLELQSVFKRIIKTENS